MQGRNGKNVVEGSHQEQRHAAATTTSCQDGDISSCRQQHLRECKKCSAEKQAVQVTS
jgi:hypothetical protein